MRWMKYGMLVLCMMMLFSGCGKNNHKKDIENTVEDTDIIITEDNVSKILKEKLEEKYGKEFIITDIQELEGGYLVDKDPSYIADVSIKENLSVIFDAKIYVKSGSVYDNYPKVIYKESIHSMLSSILESHDTITHFDYDMVYELSSENWVQSDQLDDYIKNSNSYVSIKVKYDNSTLDQIVEDVYALDTQLKEKGFHYDINIKTNGKNVMYFQHSEDSNISKEEIKNKLIR